MPLQYGEFKSFFLIFIRISVVLFMLPFFSSRTIPVLSKAGLAFIITIIIFPVISYKLNEFPETTWGVVQLIISELLVGMILGLTVQVFFEAVSMMGQLVGFQTGFAIVNILDPQSGTQTSILSNMAYMVAMVLFLTLNGHYILLGAIRESFEIINVGSLSLNKRLFNVIMGVSAEMFVLAVKIGSPAIAALLLTKVLFGLITKLIPQMNIMIVAFPVQIVIGLIFFGISMIVLLMIMERYVGDLDLLLINTMKLLRV
ncbi:MAG: flagellar biosynthetic protein FliR [Deltaproteobacteria bacterium]|nr:flagellar biosynthetic protein FliR [Deltaproteobacteria bacterium]